MKKVITVKNQGGKWVTRSGGHSIGKSHSFTEKRSEKKSEPTYKTKNEALRAVRRESTNGSVIILHNQSGKIAKVIIHDRESASKIKKAPITKKLSDQDIQIAIAKVIER
jgi:hypothetical protein